MNLMRDAQRNDDHSTEKIWPSPLFNILRSPYIIQKLMHVYLFVRSRGANEQRIRGLVNFYFQIENHRMRRKEKASQSDCQRSCVLSVKMHFAFCLLRVLNNLRSCHAGKNMPFTFNIFLWGARHPTH